MDGTTKIHEVSKNLILQFFVFVFFTIQCVQTCTVGSSWELEIKQLIMLCSKKDHYLIKAFTYKFQILSFTFVCSVKLSVCVYLPISN